MKFLQKRPGPLRGTVDSQFPAVSCRQQFLKQSSRRPRCIRRHRRQRRVQVAKRLAQIGRLRVTSRDYCNQLRLVLVGGELPWSCVIATGLAGI